MQVYVCVCPQIKPGNVLSTYLVNSTRQHVILISPFLSIISKTVLWVHRQPIQRYFEGSKFRLLPSLVYSFGFIRHRLTGRWRPAALMRGSCGELGQGFFLDRYRQTMPDMRANNLLDQAKMMSPGYWLKPIGEILKWGKTRTWALHGANRMSIVVLFTR